MTEKCSISREFFLNRDRFYYDCRLIFEGSNWRRVRTENDCGFFGIWINPVRRQILTWCEGDQILVTAPTNEVWMQKMDELKSFYEEFHIEELEAA